MPRTPLSPLPLFPTCPKIPGWWSWYTVMNYLRFPYTAMMVNQFKGKNTPFQSQGIEYSSILDFYGASMTHDDVGVT